MRNGLGTALAALAFSALVQSALAQPPKPGAAAQPQPPAPPPIFACRTQQETCFLGIVVGSQVAVVYTNADNAAGLGDKPVDVLGADGSKIDLAANAGRVVMLAGAYDAKAGIKGEVVEVASPLVSLSVKAQLGAGAQEDEPEEPPKPAPAKPRR
jgi:hypothetical protein